MPRNDLAERDMHAANMLAHVSGEAERIRTALWETNAARETLAIEIGKLRDWLERAQRELSRK